MATETHQAIIDARAQEHGDPQQAHERIAEMWSAILTHANGTNVIVRAKEVAACMVALKLVRASSHLPTSDDTYDDMAIYGGFMKRFDRAGPTDRPGHPCDTIAEWAGENVAEVSALPPESVVLLDGIINRATNITADNVGQLSAITRMPERLLLNLQANWEEWETRVAVEEVGR